ncbi:MAG: hypothetical protein WCC87_10845 [Candidatus Korobacteraceae bacterium]
MKKVLVCGMLLGLIPSLALAQRGRMAGGIGPSAHTPNVGGMPSNVGIHPNAVGISHDGIAPNATTVGNQSKTVTPNATSSKVPASAGTHPKTVPDRAIPTDTGTMSPVTGVGPER